MDLASVGVLGTVMFGVEQEVELSETLAKGAVSRKTTQNERKVSLNQLTLSFKGHESPAQWKP